MKSVMNERCQRTLLLITIVGSLLASFILLICVGTVVLSVFDESSMTGDDWQMLPLIGGIGVALMISALQADSFRRRRRLPAGLTLGGVLFAWGVLLVGVILLLGGVCEKNLPDVAFGSVFGILGIIYWYHALCVEIFQDYLYVKSRGHAKDSSSSPIIFYLVYTFVPLRHKWVGSTVLDLSLVTLSVVVLVSIFTPGSEGSRDIVTDVVTFSGILLVGLVSQVIGWMKILKK